MWCHPVVNAEHLNVGRVLNSKYYLHASHLQSLQAQAKLHGLLCATGLQMIVSRCNSSKSS